MIICSHGVLEFIKNEYVRDLGNAFFNKNKDPKISWGIWTSIGSLPPQKILPDINDWKIF